MSAQLRALQKAADRMCAKLRGGGACPPHYIFEYMELYDALQASKGKTKKRKPREERLPFGGYNRNGGWYHCLNCAAVLRGRAALNQHLEKDHLIPMGTGTA